MISKKSQKAIIVLRNYISDLDNITNVQQGNTWKATLNDSLFLYLGQDSSIKKRLEDLFFTKQVSSTVPGITGIFTDHVYDENNKENFKNLIENAIKHIESNGIVKSNIKGNFLVNFKTVEIISGLFVAGGLIFSIGNYVGKIDKEREVTELNNKKEEFEIKYQETVVLNKKLESELHTLKAKLTSEQNPIRKKN